jgi:phytoene/squalene synthetase
MDKQMYASEKLATNITRSASKQTYYTIRFFADRNRAADAYRAYAYFRWVDDVIDGETGVSEPRSTFVARQKAILDACYRGEVSHDLCAEERMLADLVRGDTETNSGLQIYLRNMMDVMLFDARRRGQAISQAELSEYSHKLARAVTEAMYHFIGHEEPAPCHEARYFAVTAAHITHMLRDAVEDVQNGYFNIPREVLAQHGILPGDIASPAYREWVYGRVQLARRYFRLGQECTARVKNLRCRLAGYAYIARFEWMLRAIERDNYCLRAEYPERKSFSAGVWMAWSTLTSLFASLRIKTEAQDPAPQPVRVDKR